MIVDWWTKCMEKWRRYNNSCPYCRRAVLWFLHSNSPMKRLVIDHSSALYSRFHVSYWISLGYLLYNTYFRIIKAWALSPQATNIINPFIIHEYLWVLALLHRSDTLLPCLLLNEQHFALLQHSSLLRLMRITGLIQNLQNSRLHRNYDWGRILTGSREVVLEVSDLGDHRSQLAGLIHRDLHRSMRWVKLNNHAVLQIFFILSKGAASPIAPALFSNLCWYPYLWLLLGWLFGYFGRSSQGKMQKGSPKNGRLLSEALVVVK